MADLTLNEGLALARTHMEQALPAVSRRDDAIEGSANLSYRWEFPAGGIVDVAIGFDVVLAGASGTPTLVPRVRLSASIGCYVAQGLHWARSVARIVAAAVETEAIMAMHTYRVEAEVAHAQNANAPYPTPACGGALAKGDYVVLPENYGRLPVTCTDPTCRRAVEEAAAAAAKADERRRP